MSAVSLLVRFVTLALVLVVLDAVLGQAVEDELLVAGRLTLDPSFHVRSHEVLHLGRAVDKVRVVEGLQDCGRAKTERQDELSDRTSGRALGRLSQGRRTLRSDRVRVHRRLFPRLDDHVDGVLEDDDRDLTRRLVQDEREAADEEVESGPVPLVSRMGRNLLVLGQERVRRIRGVRVVEDLVLVRAVDDGSAALAEDLGGLTCRTTSSSVSNLHVRVWMMAGLPMMGFSSGSKVVLQAMIVSEALSSCRWETEGN